MLTTGGVGRTGLLAPDNVTTSKDLQVYLVSKFSSWQPAPPAVVSRGRGHVLLTWSAGPFAFLGDRLIYVVEKNNKLPKWVVVYSGGKTTKRIDNLAPRHPHKFRLRVIVKAEAVSSLALTALQHHGDEQTVCEELELHQHEGAKEQEDDHTQKDTEDTSTSVNAEDEPREQKEEVKETQAVDVGDKTAETATVKKIKKKINVRDLYDAMKILSGLKPLGDGGGGIKRDADRPKWLESQWSGETWTNTDSDGTSAACFGMAVKCGYLKQLQTMLDERPELVGVVNSRSGLTPLAAAVRQGDITTVKFLLGAGAEVEQPCCAGQTPLLMAILAGNMEIVELLVEMGADLKARDWNGLGAEHCAVDSGSLEMVRFVLERGNLHVTDGNGWTPLFRALCQGASTALVEELVRRGSDLGAVDRAGLPLASAARLLRNRRGAGRDSIMRLVDVNYPHQKALAHFTRLSKKIYHVHTLIKH